jgi:hypothetical protein
MNANERHEDSLTKSDRFALWLTNRIGTMTCFYIFCGIGIAALIGALTNWEIGVICGLASSQVIQLILLPALMVGQNLQSKHAEHLADATFEATEEIKKILEQYGSNTNSSK